ncbi:MAG: S1 RNA-binding domain-containing protein [Dehalococcoidia bacterium]
MSAETNGQTMVRSGDFSEEALGPRNLHRGELVTGLVVAKDADGIWVNIGAKSEGIVPNHELQSQDGQVEVGDEVVVYVIQPEAGEGRATLSLDRAQRFEGWRLLEGHRTSGETVETTAIGFNRGGLLVRYHGIQGFVPLSQVVGYREGRQQDAQTWMEERVGQTVVVKVMEIEQERRRLILSERAAFEEQREEQKEQFLSGLKEGEVVSGRVSGIHSFGAFVDLTHMEGLVPVSELSWDRDKPAQELVELGQDISVVVMKVDMATKRLVLSLRRTQSHPWDSIAERYQEGQVVEGTVTKIMPFGAFARLDGSIEGLIHISELASYPLNNPKQVVHPGDVLSLKILSIEPERRRIRLSLRQAQDEDGVETPPAGGHPGD